MCGCVYVHNQCIIVCPQTYASAKYRVVQRQHPRRHPRERVNKISPHYTKTDFATTTSSLLFKMQARNTWESLSTHYFSSHLPQSFNCSRSTKAPRATQQPGEVHLSLDQHTQRKKRTTKSKKASSEETTCCKLSAARVLDVHTSSPNCSSVPTSLREARTTSCTQKKRTEQELLSRAEGTKGETSRRYHKKKTSKPITSPAF